MIVGADDVAESSGGWTKQEEESMDQSEKDIRRFFMQYLDILGSFCEE
jgi:hypothetical protein